MGKSGINVCMANKGASSLPLFGNASPQEVGAIQTEIEAFTSEATRSSEEARKVLKRLGIAPAKKTLPNSDV